VAARTTVALIYAADLTRIFLFKPELAIFLRTTDARVHDRIRATRNGNYRFDPIAGVSPVMPGSDPGIGRLKQDAQQRAREERWWVIELPCDAGG
jgi:hypothetical protein